MEDQASSPAGEVAPEIDEPIEDSQSEGSEQESGLEQQEADADGEASENADGSEGDGTGEPEEIELNFGGEKLRVPKGAIPEEVVAKVSEFAKNLEGGYTKKFQEVAEQRKSVERISGLADRLAALEGEALQRFSRGLQVSNELAELKNVDMNRLWQSNPDDARRLSDRINRLQGEYQQITAETSAKEQEAAQQRRQLAEAKMEEGRQFVDRRIKGFSTEKAPEVVDYVMKNYGMSKEQADTWPLNPVTAELAYKAMMYDRMQSATKTTKPAQTKPPVKPMTPIKGKGGPGSVDVRQMTPAQMAKHLGLPG